MEKPILFNTAMVRAILDGRKTQTRRLIKPAALDMTYEDGSPARKPPFSAGDILWVRETWAHVKFGMGEWHYEYRADRDDETKFSNGSFAEWRPSIHMPKEAARLFLRVTNIRVERLQEMTVQDCLDEGVKLHLNEIADGADPLLPFAELWNSTINKKDFSKYRWSANPWVWVIEFERIDKPAGLWTDRDTAQYADQDVLMPAT